MDVPMSAVRVRLLCKVTSPGNRAAPCVEWLAYAKGNFSWLQLALVNWDFATKHIVHLCSKKLPEKWPCRMDAQVFTSSGSGKGAVYVVYLTYGGSFGIMCGDRLEWEWFSIFRRGTNKQLVHIIRCHESFSRGSRGSSHPWIPSHIFTLSPSCIDCCHLRRDQN